MPTAFEDLEADVARAVNEIMGERAVVTPRTGGDYTGPVADPARTEFETVGVASIVPVAKGIAGQQPEGALRSPTLLQQAESEFWIGPEKAAAITVELRRGDHLALADRPGAPTYAIIAVNRPQTGELRLILTVEDVGP